MLGACVLAAPVALGIALFHALCATANAAEPAASAARHPAHRLRFVRSDRTGPYAALGHLPVDRHGDLGRHYPAHAGAEYRTCH